MYSQEVNHTGTYAWEVISGDAVFKRTLVVLPDGTFTFDWFRNLNNIASDEEFKWGKGTWTSKGKHIYFSTNPETEIDDKYTLNFTNTQGRWMLKITDLLFTNQIFLGYVILQSKRNPINNIPILQFPLNLINTKNHGLFDCIS